MGFVTLGYLRDNPTTIIIFGFNDVSFDTESYSVEDETTPPTTYDEGQFLGAACNGTTKVSYYFSFDAVHFVTVTTEENSTSCGYVPDVCDLAFPYAPVTTNETVTDANDGTVIAFATTSALPISYVLNGSETNETGYFTGLEPGEHTIVATDGRGCTEFVTFTIYPAEDETLTRYKYRLRFTSVLTGEDFELKFLDQQNQWPIDEYPKDLTGTASPIIRKTGNPNEDKTECFCPSSLRINIIFDAETFTVIEFADATERDWKIELYKNGDLDWQGWLLPDEIQDLYADAKYPVQLIATDGLLSLKGETYSDLSIFNIYTDGQKAYSPIFGIRKVAYLFRICLEHLGYDYGETTLVSSLVYQEYDADQWLQYSTWSDIFYDQESNPVSVYTALEILLKSLHLQIYQHEGHFVLTDINDLVYRNDALMATKFYQSVIKFNKAFTTVSAATYPANSVVGYNRIISPINPQQTLNYDRSYNRIEAKIDFNLLALLYENPSFEINSVEGELPDGFYMNNGGVPDSGLTDDDAYNGLWSFIIRKNIYTYPTSRDRFIENDAPFFTIDQPQKTAKVSFMWKPFGNTFDLFGTTWAVTFAFTPIFIEAGTSNAYFLQTTNFKPFTLSQISDPPIEPTTVDKDTWVLLNGDFSQDWAEGSAVSIKGQPTTDYIGWQSYSLQTPAFPGSGIGVLTIRIYGGAYVPFQQPDPIPLPSFDYAPYLFGLANPDNASENFGYKLDNLYITIGDAQDPYNRQIGESHLVKNLTEYSKAEKKNVDLSLFTYPTNKRVAGNFLYGDEYSTTELSNEWFFQLSAEQTPSRLPTNVIRRIAKNYQRPMYKWQGDVLSDAINYYMVFTIDGIENRVFMAFTIEMDLRNSVGNIVLIEIDDAASQASYLYTPLYEKSARNNIT